MLKILTILGAMLLVACASQPERPYYPADMTKFIASCKDARAQVDFLAQRINEYNEYHSNHPVTLEDQRYYGKLKNNLWSLRSSCSVLQR